jgi:hypothetical protein
MTESWSDEGRKVEVVGRNGNFTDQKVEVELGGKDSK